MPTINPSALATGLGNVLGHAEGVTVVYHRDVLRGQDVYTAAVQQQATFTTESHLLDYDTGVEQVLTELYGELHRQGDQAYGDRIRDEQRAEVRQLTQERDRLLDDLARAQRIIDKLTGTP
jgi:hypothetical protein